MQWFYDLKIGKKLILSFAILTVFTCALGLFSIAQMTKVSQASSDIATNWLPAVRYLGQMQNSLSRYRISEATHILLTALIAGAVLAAISAAVPAAAQSNVTLYGLLDTGVENLTHAGPGGSATRVSSGGMNNSRFGFRGTEDLGGGLKAVFNLEGGLLTDIGGSDGGGLFRRQANVGLEGSFGRVVLGRSFTTVYDFIVPFDPMAYAPFYSWASSG